MPNYTGLEARVRQLAELAIIESPIDPLFERLCGLAAGLLDMPAAFVSLIDATHQHLIAGRGIDLFCSSREDAICELTIRRETPLIIPDTLADPRVRANVFVTGEPKIRFYAGIPLTLTPGVPLGSFCVIDRVPRELTPAQMGELEDLAAIVVGQIRHHQSKREIALNAIELTNKQALLSQTERFAKVGGFEADLVTDAMRWSDEFYRISGIEASAAPTLERLLAIFKGHDKRRLRQAFTALDRDADTFDLDLTFETAAGTRHIHVHAERAAGHRTAIGILQDVSERKVALGELEWMATHDSLTNLCNRARFNRHIDEALQHADLAGHRVALIMLDIDRFKAINDTKGHDVGDVVLCAVAQRLRDVVGPRGIVARLGGDEFAVLIDRVERETEVVALAEDLLSHLRRPFIHKGIDLSTRATLGIAFHAVGGSGADLVKSADLALYNAKDAGRDGFALYCPEMREEVERRFETRILVRAAIAAGEIEPYYQPLICLETGTIDGFEALLRWRHPAKGLRAPKELGDAFADRELAVPLGQAMRDRVIADMIGWRRDDLPFGYVALNVAGPEFHGGDYAERLIACLDAHGLPHGAVDIGITESVFLGAASGAATAAIRKLAEAGISTALDEFGAGFGSLTHLKQCPVASIKIDRSFVMNIESGGNDATIVEAVISLANALKIDVVAEGIETQAQLDFLRARRCGAGQGYLFAKPMPGSRVPYFLRHWRAFPCDAAAQGVPSRACFALSGTGA